MKYDIFDSQQFNTFFADVLKRKVNSNRIYDYDLFLGDLLQSIQRNQLVEISYLDNDDNLIYDKGMISKVEIDDGDNNNLSVITGELKLQNGNVSHFSFEYDEYFTELNTMSRPGQHMKYYLKQVCDKVTVTFIFIQS